MKKHIMSLGCAAVLGLASLAPAHAAIVGGSFDPAFGGAFTGLGWSGQFRLYVPDACLALASGSLTSAACQGTTLLSASVDLYNLSNPANFETLDFMGSSLRMHLDDITISGGQFTGIYTGLEHFDGTGWGDAFGTDWLLPEGTLDPQGVNPGYRFYQYGLFLDGDMATLRANSTKVFDPITGLFADQIFNCPFDDYAICNSATNPPVTFTRLDTPPPSGEVPEPPSTALVAGALAAAVWGYRRKRRV